MITETKCLRCGSKDIQITFKKVEPELMTLQEAYDKSKYEDKIRNINWEAIEFIRKKDIEDGWRTEFKETLLKKWQIIPAEPKVLSAIEVVKQYQKTQITNFSEHGFSLKQAIELVKYAEHNGQLKYKELKEAAEAYIRNGADGYRKNIFNEALKNAKQWDT
jgi:hypothetical protein